MSVRISLLVVGLLGGPLVAGATPERRSWDVQLRDSSNAPVSLSRWRGRPTVFFYEDQRSTEQNVALKREIFARAKAHRLIGKANVLGVANLHGLDWFPVKLFALSAVREAERKESVPVLVDWDGALGAPPWSLPVEASSVVLLDADGRLVHAWSGPLGPREIDEFFARLSQLLEVDIGPAT
ncbi:MAG: peroxiredoxin family protein [Myxococcaceae bacterium]